MPSLIRHALCCSLLAAAVSAFVQLPVSSARSKLQSRDGVITERATSTSQLICPSPRSIHDQRRRRTRHGHSTTKLNATSKPSSAKRRREDGATLSSPFDLSLHKDRLLFKCLAAIVAYVAVGVCGFSRIFERWPIVDSIYFSVATFTTVGYGDLVPSTDAGKLFTIFYSFAGISIVGALLGHAGATVVEAERKAMRKSSGIARARIASMLDRKEKGRSGRKRRRAMPGSKRTGRDDATVRNGGGTTIVGRMYSRAFAMRTRRDGSKSLLRRAFDVLAQSYYVFVPFVALALYIGRREGWSTITALYYATATCSTAGYGDYAPSCPRMRLLSLLFIPLAVVSAGDILGRIAGYFVRRESENAEREFMSRRMTLEDLDAMDFYRNGEVDLFEFLRFMLSTMQKVDTKLMDDLKELFLSLDETGSNSIQKEDLILLANINHWRDECCDNEKLT